MIIHLLFLLFASTISQKLIGEVVNINSNIPLNINNTYNGFWSKVQGNNQFEKSQGKIYFSRFKSKLINFKNNNFNHLQFIQGDFAIRDGEYIQHKLFVYRVHGIYNVLNGKLEFYLYPRSLEGSNTYKNLIMKNPFNDTLIYQALIIGIQQNPISPIKQVNSLQFPCVYKGNVQVQILQEIEMKGLIQSLNCDSMLFLNLIPFHFETFFTSANNYSIMVSLLSIINIFLTVHQMSYSRSASGASKVSLLMISLQAMMDSYLCLIHLGGALIYEDLFKSFTITAFLQFILFALFEMRYLFSIWKSRRPQGFNEWENVRQEFQSFYTRFYGSMFILFIIIYQVNSVLKYFIFLLYSYWLPQIYCNFSRDSKQSLSPYYILIVGYSRLIIPLYFLSCPFNIFTFENNNLFSIILLLWTTFQIIILLLQNHYGARFMIPYFLLPSKYNYKKDTPQDILKEQTCVICMNNFENQEHLVTPCNHYFHNECLSKWMEEKMECPTCRHELPEI